MTTTPHDAGRDPFRIESPNPMPEAALPTREDGIQTGCGPDDIAASASGTLSASDEEKLVADLYAAGSAIAITHNIEGIHGWTCDRAAARLRELLAREHRAKTMQRHTAMERDEAARGSDK